MEIFLFWYRLIGNAWEIGVGSALLYGFGLLLLGGVAITPWWLLVKTLEGKVLPYEKSMSLRWLLRFALSLGFSGIIVVILGIFGWVNRKVLISIIISTLLAACVMWVYFGSPKTKPKPRNLLLRLKNTDNILIILLGVVALLVVLAVFYHALAFPVLQWDSLHYDAPMAKYLYYHGSFPETVGRSLGFGMDTGYPPQHWATAAYFYVLLNNPDDFYLRLLSPISFILLILACYETGLILGGRRLAALVALFVMLTPLAIFCAYHANYNPMLGAWVSLTLLSVILAEKKQKWQYWVLSGLFLGLTGLTSYNGYYPIVGIILSALIVRLVKIRKKGIKDVRLSLIGPLIMVCIAFLMNAPWWARNIFVFSTPWYPFLSPDPFVAEINEARLNTNLNNIYKGQIFGVSRPSIHQWLNLFFWHPAHMPSISLLALVGIVPMLRYARLGVYVIMLVLVFWSLPITQPAFHDRTAFTFVGVFALLSGLAVHKILESWRNKWVYYISVLVLIVILLGNVSPLIALGHRYRPYRPLKKKTSWSWSQNPYYWSKQNVIDTEYKKYTEGWKYINKNLQKDKRVLLAGTPSYYVTDGDSKRWLFVDSKEVLPMHNLKKPEHIRDFLLEKNVHLVYIKVKYWYDFAYEGIFIKQVLGGRFFPEVGPGVYEVKEK